jgi:hypothetical protein
MANPQFYRQPPKHKPADKTIQYKLGAANPEQQHKMIPAHAPQTPNNVFSNPEWPNKVGERLCWLGWLAWLG